MNDNRRNFEFESAKKKAQHNALTRGRRDHMEDSSSNLPKSTTTAPTKRVVYSVSVENDDKWDLKRARVSAINSSVVRPVSVKNDHKLDLKRDNAEKRAHHNALERMRRNHIKDSFSDLRESVPALQTGKMVSRARILLEATRYVEEIMMRNMSRQDQIDELRHQNDLLEIQVHALESNN